MHPPLPELNDSINALGNVIAMICVLRYHAGNTLIRAKG